MRDVEKTESERQTRKSRNKAVKAEMDGDANSRNEGRRKRRRRGHLLLAAGSEPTPEMRSEQPAGHKH